jgi:hypothetical protein
VEQTGKTLIWVLVFLYRLANLPGVSLITYESDDDAAEKNKEMVEPLMKGIPQLAAELARPNSKHLSPPACYAFTDSTSYFGGAGKAITSKTVAKGYSDEFERWPSIVSEKRQVEVQDNVSNVDKRMRSVLGAQHMLTSSAGTYAGPTGTEWRRGSRGTYQMCCVQCNHLEPSHNLLCLQWEKLEDGSLRPETIRWICPACKYEHTEAEAFKLNEVGRACYIHEFPEREATTPSFQWGALACPRAPGLNWQYIAETITEAGRRGTLALQAEVDNSIRGLWHMKRKATTMHTAKVLERCAPFPDPEKLALVLWSSDSQDEGWFWTMSGFDQLENMYVLNYGACRSQEELDLAWENRWEELLPALGVIDEGGHRSKAVQRFVASRKGLYSYKGATQAVAPHSGKYYRLNAAEDRLLVRAKHYQAELLHQLHFQPKTPRNCLYLPPDLAPDSDMVEHLCAMRRTKNKNLQDPDNLENWVNENRDDHYFDCLKQTLVLWDFAKETLALRFWRLPMPWHQKKSKKKRKVEVPYED